MPDELKQIENMLRTELEQIENMLRADSSLAPAVIVAARWYIGMHPDEQVPDWLHCLANDAGNNPIATFEEARLDYIMSMPEVMHDNPNS